MPASRHYTAHDNGLVQPWEGRVFINPPFGPGVEVWFSKMYQEELAGRTTEEIVLWKSATEAAAWRTGVFSFIEDPLCWFAGYESGSTFSPALFYVGEWAERFEEAFAGIGVVWFVPGK